MAKKKPDKTEPASGITTDQEIDRLKHAVDNLEEASENLKKKLNDIATEIIKETGEVEKKSK